MLAYHMYHTLYQAKIQRENFNVGEDIEIFICSGRKLHRDGLGSMFHQYPQKK